MGFSGMSKENTPRHVSLIPDGNRRWARRKMLKPWEGHYVAGKYENVKKILDEARKLGIKYLSVWGFSTENWKREKKEIEEIFKIVKNLVIECRKDAMKEKIRFVHVGRKDRLPHELLEEIKNLENETKEFEDFCVVLCLDYGGKDEIVRAVNKIVEKGKKVTEESFNSYLDTREIPEPDLIIRTGGEKRLSGFMPFQSVYSEIYFSEKYFPDFSPTDLRDAVEDFRKRKRNFGE